MRRALAVLGSLLFLSCGAASARADASIGASLGLTRFSPRSGGDPLNSVGAPGAPVLLEPLNVPGLRVGFGRAGATEGFLDLGLVAFSARGTSASALDFVLGVQQGLAPEAAAEPYVTGSVGLFHGNVDPSSTTNPEVGGGFGIRSNVAHGYGSLRFEARFDHYFEDTKGFRGGNAISLKVGFDLWVSRHS